MESTVHYSVQMANLPVITFVGRPLDQNKGLICTLDTAERLLSLKGLPTFALWIIGGDHDECTAITRMVLARPVLSNEHFHGRLIIWGQVSRSSLPEFYRRSQLVIMPSLREPFGLVAIEAQMCGCPVVGSRTGGISDTVLHGQTGFTVDVDSPVAFAAAIAQYLRNPQLRRVHGRLARLWAESSFEVGRVYGRIAELYHERYQEDVEPGQWDLPSTFIQTHLENVLPAVQNAIGDPIRECTIVSFAHHIVAKVRAGGSAYAMKIFRDRPSITSSLFPFGPNWPRCRLAKEFVRNAFYHKDNPVVAKLITRPNVNDTVLFDWIDGDARPISFSDILAVTRQFAVHGAGRMSDETALRFRESAHDFLKQPTMRTLEATDRNALCLREGALGDSSGTALIHPSVELHRMMLALQDGWWITEEDVQYRIRMSIQLALEFHVDIDAPIRLCHGDLQRKHLLSVRDTIIAIDTESNSFSAGSLDLGTWLFAEIRDGLNPLDAVTLINDSCADRIDRNGAIQWLTYFLIRHHLAELHSGSEATNRPWIRRVLQDLSIGLVQLTP